MTETTDTTDRWNDHPDALEADIIIGRVVDGEATSGDRRRFDDLAGADPLLWKVLALRHEDDRRLRDAFREATASARRVDLPAPASLPLRRPTWMLAASGWAAVIIVALSWGIMSSGEPGGAPTGGVETAGRGAGVVPVARHTDNLRQYLDAPYVLGQLQPLVTDVEELTDGRIALHIIRRIEEIAFVDPDRLPLDERGQLIDDPDLLRQGEPAVGWPSDGPAPG